MGAMDVSSILDGLNEAQRQAVGAPPGNILVLAGAGSGKTRVLAHRVAWHLQAEQTMPHGVLAVTFTNKAAGEMRERIEALLRRPLGGMWIGTFHSIAHRLLRLHRQEARLPEGFQIIDQADQQRLAKRIVVDQGLDENLYPPKEVQRFINANKDAGLRPDHVDLRDNPRREQMAQLYRAYQQVCERAGLVDFAELLLRAHELFRDNEGVLEHYRGRFRRVLVDEFQDTNRLQYAWLRLLAGRDNHLFAVGDDDQSIYGFRGARMENIQRFEKDFPDASLFRLEQNYRSTTNILNAANALIANNATRLGKNLWSDGAEGDKLELYEAANEYEEAHFVAERIRTARRNGADYRDNAILYRVGAASRVFENVLRQEGMPYRVFGGLRFYDRMEIKDALAYLRLAVFQYDDAAFERIVNTPARDIGQRTLEEVRNRARADNTSLWQGAVSLAGGADGDLKPRARAALGKFIELVERMAQDIQDKSLDEAVRLVIKSSGLEKHYQKEKNEKELDRIENLRELENAAEEFEVNEDVHGELEPLQAFLSQAALEAGEAQAGDQDDAVSLMTLHTSKGLEFPQVFLVSMEDGMFPHQRSLDEPAQLEEERRLCYVGITRAQKQLTLSCARRRRLHGRDVYPLPSRFLRELPQDLLSVGYAAVAALPVSAASLGDAAANGNGALAGGDKDIPFGLGQRVRHARFGEGTVLNMEGRGEHARIQVNFKDAGAKWLVLAYAKLQAA